MIKSNQCVQSHIQNFVYFITDKSVYNKRDEVSLMTLLKSLKYCTPELCSSLFQVFLEGVIIKMATTTFFLLEYCSAYYE